VLCRPVLLRLARLVVIHVLMVYSRPFIICTAIMKGNIQDQALQLWEHAVSETGYFCHHVYGRKGGLLCISFGLLEGGYLSHWTFAKLSDVHIDPSDSLTFHHFYLPILKPPKLGVLRIKYVLFIITNSEAFSSSINVLS
jgi:hypothetical protein